MKYIIAPTRPNGAFNILRLEEFLNKMSNVQVVEISQLSNHLLLKGFGYVMIETDLPFHELRKQLVGFIVEKHD